MLKPSNTRKALQYAKHKVGRPCSEPVEKESRKGLGKSCSEPYRQEKAAWEQTFTILVQFYWFYNKTTIFALLLFKRKTGYLELIFRRGKRLLVTKPTQSRRTTTSSEAYRHVSDATTLPLPYWASVLLPCWSSQRSLGGWMARSLLDMLL